MAIALAGAGPRALLVVAAPLAIFTVLADHLPRPLTAWLSILTGVLAIGAGLIARSPLAAIGGALFLANGVAGAWGANRGLPWRRAWALRSLIALGAAVAAFFVVMPALVAVDYLAKPRSAIDDGSLGLQHARVHFTASDGVELSGWYVPSRNGAAVVLVHGGGGDRQGAIQHARMLAQAGYGVLLYDARGRGDSGGRENAAGWEWDRDVHGAVSYLTHRGIDRIGLLGLSTGAEAAVTEAAADSRVRAVVADGLQGRTVADAAQLDLADRVSIQPTFAVAGAVIRVVRGEPSPTPLIDVVHEVARTRPLLLIATESFERRWDRAYVRGTNAALWELPGTAHTKGLADHRRAYSVRVLSLLDTALR